MQKSRFPFDVPENQNYDMFDWITQNPRLSDKMISVNNAIFVSFLL